ncbi:transglycosylase SLT domain-containing protein [Clostridium hydrogeniformans]|uniref:transglycosylase SLT domain-containing protein n=1 Tax=Clostridium hydrogeniformans TaxID=349933 RepID=UPI000483219A|nr:transglycosylase SLT domain-containing protein [Clostridium hydrogeniformans]
MRKIFTSIFIILLVVGITFTIGSKVLYPLKYKDYVKQYSSKYKVDPYILASLVHEESTYRDNEYDSSRLNGIPKVTDEVALKLSKEMKLKDFKPEDIADPKIGIEMTAYLLSKGESGINLTESIKPFIIRNKDKSKNEIDNYSNHILRCKAWYRIFHFRLV